MNMGVSQEGKHLLNIVSQKLISYDFCTSFVLHKVKKTFGRSKWKLIVLTLGSGYLAYVRQSETCHGREECHAHVRPSIGLWVPLAYCGLA
jgi:hypothetical protein